MSKEDVLLEIKQKFEGKWKVDRSEHFEDFMREVGVNFLVRKMAAMAKPASEIKVVGDQIQITMNAGFTSHTDVYNLNEECDREHQGAKQKALLTFEDGKMIINLTPLPDAKIKPQKTTREIVGEEILMTMEIGNVVCTRYLKRIKDDSSDTAV